MSNKDALWSRVVNSLQRYGYHNAEAAAQMTHDEFFDMRNIGIGCLPVYIEYLQENGQSVPLWAEPFFTVSQADSCGEQFAPNIAGMDNIVCQRPRNHEGQHRIYNKQHRPTLSWDHNYGQDD